MVAIASPAAVPRLAIVGADRGYAGVVQRWTTGWTSWPEEDGPDLLVAWQRATEANPDFELLEFEWVDCVGDLAGIPAKIRWRDRVTGNTHLVLLTAYTLHGDGDIIVPLQTSVGNRRGATEAVQRLVLAGRRVSTKAAT